MVADDDDDDRPAPDRLLHGRCMANDPAALIEVADRHYRPLLARLASRPRFRRTDPQLVADAVTDAVIEYVRQPGGYDPAAGRALDAHLAMAAERNLLNLLRSEGRRKRREQSTAADHSGPGGGEPVELVCPAGNALSNESAKERDDERRRLLALFADPGDRRVLELRLAGERSTAAYAAVLGVERLPAAEQRVRVKRVKDRIDKVVRRAACRPAGGD